MARAKTSITLKAELLEEARRYGVNLSEAAGQGVEAVVKAERWRRWREENREGMEELNRWVEENGLPLARYRRF